MRDFARYVILAPLKPADATSALAASRRTATADADGRERANVGGDPTGVAGPSPADFAAATATRFGACP